MSKKKFAHKQVSTAPAQAVNVKKDPTINSSYAQMASWFVLLLSVLPIIFSREVQDPALTPRYLLLSIFAGLFGLYFYVFRKSETILSFPPLIRYTFLTGLAFFGWNIFCLFSAVNPTAGFYETTRLLLNLLILFFVLDMVSHHSGSILRICKVLVVIGIVQSVVGLLQFYDVAFANLPGANAKPYGLMANRNLFGSAQVFILPFVIYVLYQANQKWKYVSIASLLLLIASLIVSQTRAAWLATAVFLVLCLVLVLIYAPVARKKWLVGTAVAIAATFCIGFLILAGDSEGSLRKEVKERTKSLVNAASDTSASQANVNDRLAIWKKTSALAKKNLLTGVGPCNWKLEVLSSGGAGTGWSAGFYVPDRVHNVYLQTVAELGVPGLLLYLLFYLLIAVVALKVIIKPASEQQRILMVLMLGGLGAFATDSMFSFPTERIEHMLYIMLMSGFILGSYVSNQPAVQGRRALPKWFPGVILFIAMLNIVMAIKKHSFEKNLTYAIAAENQKLYNELLAYADAGKNDWVNVDQLGISLQAKEGIAYKEQKKYDEALAAMKEAMKINPNSAMLYNNIGTIYTEMKDYKTAISYYERALRLTPTFDIVKKNLAMNYFNVGNYKGTVALLKSINISDDQYLQGALAEATKLAATQQ